MGDQRDFPFAFGDNPCAYLLSLQQGSVRMLPRWNRQRTAHRYSRPMLNAPQHSWAQAFAIQLLLMIVGVNNAAILRLAMLLPYLPYG